MDLKEVRNYAKKEGLRLLNIKFIDLPGVWQQFTVPITELDENSCTEGFGFDGSSIRGFQDINESDMVLIPDLTTAVKDPISNALSIICNIKDPISKKKYTRDPRYIAQKAEEYLKSSGIGDIAYVGPEAEFFLFDHVTYGQSEYTGFYSVDSKEGIWNSGVDEEGGNLAYKPRHKEGYFPVPPTDSIQHIRDDMVLTMMDSGIEIECHHHEVATAGQCEIDIKYTPLLKCADKMMMYKYIVKNIAKKHSKTATFMPKPLFNDNGSGMHTHMSIWKDGKNLFAGDSYAGLSEIALHFIGGILKHARALVAFTNPTTNSYKRLVPGFEAPVNLVYSKRNRSAAIRIPMYSENPKSKRMEFRSPDASCNPYLAFSAMLMAGLDGIKNKIDPGEPADLNLYDLSASEAKNIQSLPQTLQEALDELEADHGFLTQGGVFTQDVIDMWISYKREEEVNQVRIRPHPWEFHLYFDI